MPILRFLSATLGCYYVVTVSRGPQAVSGGALRSVVRGDGLAGPILVHGLNKVFFVTAARYGSASHWASAGKVLCDTDDSAVGWASVAMR